MRRNTLVEIQQLRSGSDWVDDAEVWDKVCDLYVSLTPTSGREFVDNERIASETTHTMRADYDPRVTPAMRAVDNHTKRRFEFVSIVNREERNRELLIQAKEIV